MYYFASDIHLGLQIGSDPENRERLLVQWLDEVSKDADAIFLVGDIFDFWYEYRYVVPKGFTRLLGKLSELTDHGIPVHFSAATTTSGPTGTYTTNAASHCTTARTPNSNWTAGK